MDYRVNVFVDHTFLFALYLESTNTPRAKELLDSLYLRFPRPKLYTTNLEVIRTITKVYKESKSNKRQSAIDCQNRIISSNVIKVRMIDRAVFHQTLEEFKKKELENFTGELLELSSCIFIRENSELNIKEYYGFHSDVAFLSGYMGFQYYN